MDYTVSLQTISWFNEIREMKRLEISPKFQRRAVWLEKERSELIETIFSNLPLPEVYIQVVTNSQTGQQQYIVVDGQQRITSILKFIDGEISLPLSSKWDGANFSKIDEDGLTNFWNYNIVVRYLRNTNDAEIRELFQRLNTNNFSLNDQELRNARYSGKFKQVSERFADDAFFQHIGLFTAREVRRMEDIEYVSELLLLIIAGVQNKKDLLEDYYANYNEEFPNESEVELEFRSVLSLIQSITDEENQSVIKTKSNFYSIFGAVLRYYRKHRKTTFSNPSSVQLSISDLLNKVRVFRTEEVSDPYVNEYFDAVSRASSDKQRRVRREEIIYHFILEAEQQQ